MTIQHVTTIPPAPRRPADSHKGTFGKVLIVAGRPGMSGAAGLSGTGALRGGAGLVYVAVPSTILATVASYQPSYLTFPLCDDEHGNLRADALEEIHSVLEGKDACGIGPGLGTEAETQRIVGELFQKVKVPMVFDADALNCLAKNPEQLNDHAAARILTPHPGEFGRLTGKEIKEVQQNRNQLAIRFASENNVVLVLKGHQTIVTDGARLFENTTGNSGMATGGTGDVLTGLTTALLAQKMEPFEAAQLAVFLHGRAGDLAAQQQSQPGLIAADLLDFLGPAWLTL